MRAGSRRSGRGRGDAGEAEARRELQRQRPRRQATGARPRRSGPRRYAALHRGMGTDLFHVKRVKVLEDRRLDGRHRGVDFTEGQRRGEEGRVRLAPLATTRRGFSSCGLWTATVAGLAPRRGRSLGRSRPGPSRPSRRRAGPTRPCATRCRRRTLRLHTQHAHPVRAPRYDMLSLGPPMRCPTRKRGAHPPCHPASSSCIPPVCPLTAAGLEGAL